MLHTCLYPNAHVQPMYDNIFLDFYFPSKSNIFQIYLLFDGHGVVFVIFSQRKLNCKENNTTFGIPSNGRNFRGNGPILITRVNGKIIGTVCALVKFSYFALCYFYNLDINTYKLNIFFYL